MSETNENEGRLVARLRGLAANRGALALFDQGVVSATSFATSLLVGRAVSEEEFALYGLAFGVALLVLNIQSAVIATPLTVLLPRTPEDERPSYVGSTLVHQLCVAGVTALLLGAVSAAMASGLRHEAIAGLGKVLGALALVVVFMLFREYARRVSFANMRMGAAVALDVSVSVLQLGALAALWLTGRLSVPLAYLTIGAACGLSGLGWFLKRREQFRPRRERLLPDLKRNLRLGVWVGLYTLAAVLSAEVYPWLLVLMHGKEVTGRLVAARFVVFLANPLMLGMGNFLGPRTAHARMESRQALNGVVARAALFIGGCMTAFLVLMYFVGGPLAVLIYGKYSGLGGLIFVLTLRYLIGALDTPINAALVALDRAPVVFASNAAGAVVALGLGIYLIDRYALMGTAWTMVITGAVVAGIRWLGYLRALRVEYSPDGTPLRKWEG